jgi:anti-sigma factor RsiW
MKISNEDLMNYVDGTLTAGQVSRVEEHLRAHPEDAELVSEMKLAVQALHDWDAAEPVQVSADFWPRLRDKLPAKPGRSLWRKVGELVWPSQSRLGLSVRAAAVVVAAILFMAASWFSPKQAVHQVSANADDVFIQQSLQKHSAYVQSQPLSAPLPPGDVKSADHTDSEPDGEHLP